MERLTYEKTRARYGLSRRHFPSSGDSASKMESGRVEGGEISSKSRGSAFHNAGSYTDPLLFWREARNEEITG